MLVIENWISDYLYHEIFSKSNEEKRTAFQSMTSSLILYKNTIKNCSTILQAFSFRSLSLCALYFLFHKGKDNSGIPQPSVQYLVYLFPIFFRFHKCFNSFHLTKNIFINKFVFFQWNVFLYSFTSKTQGSCQSLFEVK